MKEKKNGSEPTIVIKETALNNYKGPGVIVAASYIGDGRP